ncbi:hypothetical protein DFO45_1606 [Azorhizobium sp. AG788]|uniref:hypothetical protein n=1 Tax=Azorhizobium sp. AG788 TaxID=2183897 RepID=UPI00105CFB62|nr:hypothetical protein [Azorhizobium sp. AG788]TDT96414.1 hypothetical protein DFO45_1606 [Azorhizobium sp. AG788]
MDWILPKRLDNSFPGHPAVVWIFVALTLVTLGRSLFHMFAPDGGAQSVAHIPLSTYPAAAASTIIFVFALWGLSQLLMGLVYVVALIRYRGLIPLLLLLMAAEYAGRMLVATYRVLETTATPPGAVADHLTLPLALILLAFCHPRFRKG